MKILCRFMRQRALRLLLLMVSCVGFFIFCMTLSVQFKFVRNAYGPIQAVYYAVAVLPVNLYTVFPMLLITTVWLLFYRLHSKGELLHIFSMGVSPNTIGAWLMLPWCLWVSGMVVFGECVGPLLEKHAKKMRMQAMLDYRVVEEAASLWLKESDGFTEALRTTDHHVLTELKRYIFRNDQIEAILISPRAQYVQNAWHWEAGEKILFSPNIRREASPSFVWPTRLTPQLLHISSVEERHRPLYQAIFSLWLDPLGIVASKNIWLCWERFLKPLELLLVVIGMTYGLSRVILWRLHQHMMTWSLIIASGSWFGLAVCSRFLHNIFPEYPLISGCATLGCLLHCIYHIRCGSMVWVNKAK